MQPTLPQNVLVGSLDSAMEPTGVSSLAGQIKARRPSARVLSVGGTNCAAAAAVATWVADYVVCAQRSGRQWHPVAVAGHELPVAATRALAVRSSGARRGPLVAEMQGWRPAEQGLLDRTGSGQCHEGHLTDRHLRKLPRSRDPAPRRACESGRKR